ncbi:MAG: 23S rRNA (cytosine(1962)-C(5))-methyltransferase RlmI [Acidimicrobiales bacterium mtb01]|nr:class I SAM-dependent rRNA methyltransferase [Actinomycetota bacterium]TEX48437.1 MAG: 23S rRNA (cytosine(1962)-C(5))-methyltransferase RlmI [Acidimicrobiales bacterium mtb01]
MSGSVDRVTGDPQPGDTVLVIDDANRPVALASYSPHSSIRARVWTFDIEQSIDDDFVANRVAAAAERRHRLGIANGDAVRLVFGEADGLPGLVVDRYGPVVVFQITTVGVDARRDAVVSALASLDGVECVYERSDGDNRSREGLEPRTGVRHGSLPADVWAREGDLRFHVDVEHGHKTGFYIDQRDSRRLVARHSRDRAVLNVFGYTGSFSVAAARGGAASITTIDSSGPALRLAEANARANNVDIGDLVEADAFTELRSLRDRRASFDLIVLDPPKLANNPNQVDRATRAYKDLNLLALKLLRPGGLLFTYSCSGAVSSDLFQKVVAGAAVDANREAHIVGRLGQPSDHPIPLHFPEAEYLKGLIVLTL